jgi:hypothetical protein
MVLILSVRTYRGDPIYPHQIRMIVVSFAYYSMLSSAYMATGHIVQQPQSLAQG